MKDIYEVYYRDLSNDGVHPSLSSLRRYIAVRENGHVEGFRHGPDATDVRNAIMTACVAVIYVAQFGQHFFEWEDRDDAFKECWETYKQLIEVERSRIGGSQS
jgi:hypothetical protein